MTPGTTYHYRIKATNELGTTYSNDIEFKTWAFAPTITVPIDFVTIRPTSATINGRVSPGYASTIVIFEWGKTTSYGNIISAAQSPLTGSEFLQVSAVLTGLTMATTYHYRIKATNKIGITFSDDKSFTTTGCPPETWAMIPTDVQTRSAILNGGVYDCHLLTSVIFEWGRSTTYGNTIAAVQNPVTGSDYSAYLSGLEPGTLYHYRIRATNVLGTSFGNDWEFRTRGFKPNASSKPATNVAINTATLNGSVNPNSLPTTIIFEWGTSTNYENSVISSISPVTSNNEVNVSFDLSGLSPEITYYFRIKAENELGTALSSGSLFKTYSVFDGDNNYYHSKTIGTQTWLTENLKATKYNNGDLIGTTDPGTKDITSESFPKYQWAPEGGEDNVPVYGRLYTWYTVTDSRNICPADWHVPSDAEWTTLVDFLGGKEIAGGKLKESGTTHWNAPNEGGSNTSGFTALPSGIRTSAGFFFGLNTMGAFWTSSEFDETRAWDWNLSYGTPIFDNSNLGKGFGYGVRCIKD